MKFCYMGVISTEKLLCVLITSLTLSLVYIIGSSGRIRPTTGTWAEPLFSVPNLIHDVPLNGSGDCIERGEHKVGQEGGCAPLHARNERSRETYIAHVITSADDICQQSASKNAYFAGSYCFADMHANEMQTAMHSTWQCGADKRACQPVDG